MMLVAEEKAQTLAKKLLKVSVSVAREAHNLIGTSEWKPYFFSSKKYPCLTTDKYYDESYLSAEEREKIPYLKYRIPKYGLGSFPKERLQYELLFERENGIKLRDNQEVQQIKDWIESDEELLKAFTKQERLGTYFVISLVRDIVERYLYMTSATDNVPDNIEELLLAYVAEKLLFFLNSRLKFDICIPICLATFSKDVIKLDETVEIVRIEDNIQIARQVACKYEVDKEDWVAACATHMVIFHGYGVDKDDDFSFNSIMQDYSSYPLEKIDEIFGIIRIATGYPVGYEQIFCIPDEWVEETKDDIVAVYGAKAHFVNPKYLKRFWTQLPVSSVDETGCDEIALLYAAYKQNHDKLKFPVMRFNRCLLRDEVDDMTADACIGLESLLAGEAHGEITFTISSRIPIVFAGINHPVYTSINSRGYMKKIYNLRSRIVHGSKLKDKDLYIESGDTKIAVSQMAVDFLRYTLLFMLKNPIYLEVNAIDSNLDTLVGMQSFQANED